jgi:hypothetical protein
VIVNDDAERAADEVAAMIGASPQVRGLSEDPGPSGDPPADRGDTAGQTAKDREGHPSP